ncbi:MAG: hypothetical protein LBD06_11295 [Candidatus Accumulibacter sp.]|nr:hypothetical protein [Accumulibacter sp.]
MRRQKTEEFAALRAGETGKTERLGFPSYPARSAANSSVICLLSSVFCLIARLPSLRRPAPP